MNWLQKLSTQFEIYKWVSYTHKALEALIPGKWIQSGSAESFGINYCVFIGDNILINPNHVFFIRVEMIRTGDPIPRSMNSNYGNRNITFKCLVYDHKTRRLIEKDDMLDTLYEIATFVKNVIQNYNPDNDDENNPDFTPEMPTAPAENVPEFAF